MAYGERIPKQARLTADAAEGWERACIRHGVTFTVLIEELGLLLHDGDDTWIPEPAIEAARRLDRARHNTRP